MSRTRRVASIVLSVLMVASGILLLLTPKAGLILVTAALGIALVAYGMGRLVYYFTMARLMVGGLSMLFVGIIAIDAGTFVLSLINQPKTAIVLYLVGYNVLSAALAIMRAMEARKFQSHWKATMAHGVICLALAIACIVFAGSEHVIVWIICAILFYRAGVRVATALKPTEIVYIQ